jgi:hypothetical protein
MPRLEFRVVPGQPRPDTQPFWTCPTGVEHSWVFRRGASGEGFYRCRLCASIVEKRDLKRATDNPEE